MRLPVKLNVVVPVGLLALALAGVAWFDLTTGGEATPAPPVGAIGTPIRNAYIAPTATPQGAPTAKPRPTVLAPTPGSEVQGTPADRDTRRKLDLALLLQAAQKFKAQAGAYPSTDGKVQSLCTYEDLDRGCKFHQYLNGTLPKDPLGSGYNYWYSSDGTTARFYTSLEEDLNGDKPCETDDAELVKHANVICVTAP
jgi:hypothetical protein